MTPRPSSIPVVLIGLALVVGAIVVWPVKRSSVVIGEPSFVAVVEEESCELLDRRKCHWERIDSAEQRGTTAPDSLSAFERQIGRRPKSNGGTLRVRSTCRVPVREASGRETELELGCGSVAGLAVGDALTSWSMNLGSWTYSIDKAP